MSRVKTNQKFVNTSKYDSSITNCSKMTRSKGDFVDYTKATSLSSWLFLKYDMSYKTYRNKSKSKRQELKDEYLKDTGKLES